MGEHVLGIDLGTTSVKAGVFDGDGAVVAQFGEGYDTTRAEGGRAEQNPDGWVRLIKAALSQFRAAGHLQHVARGALTSQVNTHVFQGRDGAALMPAILWQDTRAAAKAQELDARVSEADKITWLGAPIPIDASHPLARMLWVQRHRPEIWERTAHVLLPALTLAALGVLALIWLVLEQTNYGRRLYAIGGNIDAARLAGVRVKLLRLSAFAVTGVGAAFAGLIGGIVIAAVATSSISRKT